LNTHSPLIHCARSTVRQRFGRKMLSQRGYSIIELSIALAILAVIIIGGLLGVQTILRNNRTNDMLKNIPLVAANATKLTASLPILTGAGIATGPLAALGVWPASMLNGISPAQTVTNEHGGSTFLEANIAAAGTYAIGQTFVLALTGIPQASCADVASGIDSISLVTGIANTPAPAVAVTATPAAGALAKAFGGTLNVGTLATLCGTAGNKNIIAVIAR
jgi:prepilin-type N-terminal cleavage/methylation domain-containing protein